MERKKKLSLFITLIIISGFSFLFFWGGKKDALAVNYWELMTCIMSSGCEKIESGAKCCGAGGCPELGDKNPGAWAGYSWTTYDCTFPLGVDCVTYTFKSSYECYSGDICRAGYSTSDSLLEAGQCNVSGSSVNCYSGGSYKQCCSGTCPSGGYANGTPISESCGGLIENRGGDRYGSCNVGSSSACDSCGGGGFIPCSGWGSFAEAYGSCKMGIAPPPTSGPTPGITPIPTPPPPAGRCPDYASWCTNPSNCTNNGCTVYDTPYGACSYSGDICCGCPGVSSPRIGVNIKETSHEVGSQVVIEVYQEPANTSSSSCYYDGIDVKVNNPGGTLLPPDFTVCRATGFQSSGASNSCSWKPSGASGNGRCRTCIWDTNNIQAAPDGRAKDFPIRQYPTEPSGYYVAGVYYGGHGDPGCHDSSGSASDDTTLWGDSDIWVDPLEGCPQGTVKQEVSISAHVDTAFNSLRGWTTLYGQPSIMNRYSNCCFRSRGNCDPWGHCGDIQPYNGTNFVTYKEQCGVSPYAIRTRIPIPEENIGKEYIASVMGTGVKAAHPADESKGGASRPNMRLVSGDLTTKDYQFGGDCTWEEGAYKMVARDSWLDIYLISKTVRTTNTVDPPQAAFDNLRLYYCAPPCVDTEPAAVDGNSLFPRGGVSLQDDQVVLQWGDIGDNHTNWGLNCTGNDDRYIVYLCKEGLGCSDGNVPEAYENKVCDFADNNDSTLLYCPLGDNEYLDLDWESTYHWKVVTSNGAKTASSPIASFKITHPSAWWQTKTGDVYGNNILSPIWREVPEAQRYFSLENPTFSGPKSGLVAAPNCLGSSGARCNFGAAQATQTDFPTSGQGGINADFTPLLNDYSYDQLAHLVDLAIKDNKQESYNSGVKVIRSDKINKADLVGASAGLYYYPPYGTGDMAVSLDNPFSVGASEKLVIFVEDDLDINRNITVTSGGFLAFIVSGDIEIAANVTQVQGVYFANGSLTVESAGDTSEQQFNGQGIFVGKEGISLKRDFRSDANTTTPAEIFTFDPAYLFTAPKVFREKPYLWQEVIP